ncbi:hypothetical protein [Streptomyces sp. NPDC001205]
MGLLVLAAGLALSGCGTAPLVTPSISRPVTVQGRTITATTEVGGCQSARLTADESAKTVSLTLRLATHREKGEMCPAFIALRPVSTTVRQPVGTRALVDASSGKRLN